MAGIIKTSVNLSNIPKDKIIEGKKGKYLPLTITINDEVDNYGNHGPVIVSQSKEERDDKAEKVYLGNVQVIWTNGTFPERVEQDKSGAPSSNKVAAKAKDDLPF